MTIVFNNSITVSILSQFRFCVTDHTIAIIKYHYQYRVLPNFAFILKIKMIYLLIFFDVFLSKKLLIYNMVRFSFRFIF